MAASTPSPTVGRVMQLARRGECAPGVKHNWFLPGGTQLMVTKNQLPSATHCGIV